MQPTERKQTSVKGYPLFFVGEENRHRNRGVILANIVEDHMKEGMVSARGTATLLEYYRTIGASERQMALDKLNESLRERGVEYYAS